MTIKKIIYYEKKRSRTAGQNASIQIEKSFKSKPLYTWKTPQPVELFNTYKEQLFNKEQPKIESKESIKDFHTLQKGFEKYYKDIKESPNSYKSGNVEAEPTLYNQLVK